MCKLNFECNKQKPSVIEQDNWNVAEIVLLA